MDRTADKRVLLIGGDPAFEAAFRQAVGAAEPKLRRAAEPAPKPAPEPTSKPAAKHVAAQHAGPAGAHSACPTRHSLLADLSVETAGDLPTALRRIHAAGAWPYLVAVIHPSIDPRQPDDSSPRSEQGDASGSLSHVVSEVCRADAELPLLVCLSDADVCELAEMPVDRALRLRLPLQAEEVRRLLAAQIDRRLIRLQTSFQLKSMQQTVDQVKERAAAADRARSEMLANVSHELRTPLNAIQGFSRLLMKEPLEPGQREKLDYVCRGAEALRDQVEHLLDFARLTAGQIKLSQTAFQLDQVIHGVLENARGKAESKGLAVYCHLSESVPRWLRGDRSRLGQLLGNLVDNAIKFTPQGAVQVQVVLDDQTAEQATLRITVSDTGVGIPPDRQAEIFESFAQGDGSSTRRYGGQGLGLAICKKLIDLMGGQIGFRSAPGQGSSFWVWLTLPKAGPVARQTTRASKAGSARPGTRSEVCSSEAQPSTDAALEASDSQPRTEAPDAPLRTNAPLPGEGQDTFARRDSAGPRSPGVWPQCARPPGPGQHPGPGKPRVLVAQPDQLSLSMAEMFFGRAGCLVDRTASPTEAMGALRQASYDLVLIDAELLEPVGPGALEEFRRHEAACGRRATVVVLISGESSAAAADWERCGADRCIVKPCQLECLLELVDHCVKRCQSVDEVRADSDRPDGAGQAPNLGHPAAEDLAALARELEQGNWAELDADAGRVRRRYLQAGCRPLADAALRVQLAARSSNRERTATAIGRLQEALTQQAGPDTLRNTYVRCGASQK